MNEQTQYIPQQGWLEIAKVRITEWFSQLNISWPFVLELFIAMFLGAVGGFFVRKIGKQLIFAIVFITIIVLLLQYFQFVTIEWTMIREAFGVKTAQTMQDAVKYYVLLLQNKLPTVIAALIGFLIGYRMG